MARQRKPAADKEQFVPADQYDPPKQLPKHIEIDPDRDLEPDVIDYLAKRAAYVGTFHEDYDEDRLNWLINVDEPLATKRVAQWNEIMSVFYPPRPLIAGENPGTHTADAKVKAHFLKNALSHLLRLTGAPATVVSDLGILLDGYPVKWSAAYSIAQRELLLNKKAKYTTIAKRSGVDQSEISQAVKAGHLIDPWRKGRG